MKNPLNRRLFAGLLLGLLVAGCKVSKDVPPPDLGLPASYRTAPADTASVATIAWQNFFLDPQLKSLIGEALTHNNDLLIAVQNIEAAQLTLRQARLGQLPALSLQAAVVVNRPSDNSLNGLTLSQFLGRRHVEDYVAGAGVSWEADIWGRIRSQKAAALADYLRTEAARSAVQTQLVSQVAQGYYNLLMLDAQLAIARRNIQLNDSTLRIIQLQFQAGQVTAVAVQQAQAQQLTASRLVPQFEQEQAVQENALSVLSGRLPAGITRGTPLEAVAVARQLAAGVPADLLRRRPDIRSADLALVRANALVGVAKASLYPALTITAQGGLDAFKASNWFNIPASLFGTATGGLVAPVFQRRVLRTQYDLAKVAREQTVLQFRQAVLVGVEEVSDALIQLDKLDQQQRFAAARVATLRQATHNAQQLFQNGLANYLEVITAQSNALQSELELATLKRAQLDATVSLYRSVGGGAQ
ncbi:efflux transporter outer membrane subunit [Hymenobacter terricola]|uniref:efflux transporter outer membrane subunit n=1 Tax=Hymenobacter terricola TaxID=2819236 RepID=UPI001B31348D|nr:efflux transporter outer membrane subunit [Hymenobacter terricola]